MQRAMERPGRERSSEVIIEWSLESAIAGMLAGATMAMFAMIVAWLADDGFWAPPRAITAVFFGEEYLGRGFAGSVVAGAGIHMVLSAAFGMVYAVLLGVIAPRLPLLVQLAGGVVWGLVLWALNTFAIAPALPGGELFTEAMPAWAWFVGHLLFGMVLALVYAAWRHETTALTPRATGGREAGS